MLLISHIVVVNIYDMLFAPTTRVFVGGLSPYNAAYRISGCFSRVSGKTILYEDSTQNLLNSKSVCLPLNFDALNPWFMTICSYFLGSRLGSHGEGSLQFICTLNLCIISDTDARLGN